MVQPSIRIVSLTVTESGYYLDPATGQFQESHREIMHDIANINRPKTAFGAIVAALGLRREQKLGPFTCQSCDNLRSNGSILREIIVSMAHRIDPQLGDWIETNCTFPCSMVDCIVPPTGQDEFKLVRSFGIEDAVPVTHEDYRQWVIEDRYCAGRPQWEKVGVIFSDQVRDYETMKLRMLNAGHQVVANAGELLSIQAIADCMTHPVIQQVFRKIQREDIIPHVKQVPDIIPEDYLEILVRRFSNPSMVDTPRRICFEGSTRHPGFVLPIVRQALELNASVGGLALAEALWARMCAGTREDGSEIEPNDPFWNDLQQTAKAAKQCPRIWLKQRWIYGDLIDADEFVTKFEFWLDRIWRNGCRQALVEYLST